MSAKKDEGDSSHTRRPGENGSPPAGSHLPPDLQQANVGNVKKLEEDVAPPEPIQQYREGRRRRKPASPPKQ